MNAETKIYSDFIKRNKVAVRSTMFAFLIDGEPKIVPLSKDDDGKWYAAEEDKCYTQKAAVYWYLKNNTNLK